MAIEIQVQRVPLRYAVARPYPESCVPQRIPPDRRQAPRPRGTGQAALGRSIPGLLAGLALVFGMALGAAPAPAQEVAQAPPAYDDPAQDILIEGIGFSKLILEIEQNGAVARLPGFAGLLPLLEKNLCWSGLFSLHGGVSRHCRLRSRPSRTDMRLRFAGSGTALGVRLQDAGPEELVLFEDVLELAEPVTEERVIDLVNRIAQRITGEPGLLGSTIAFVLRQPGYSKVIVATTTHGERLKLISANRDISLLPHWSPSGDALAYTVLGRNGSAVYYHSMLREAGLNRESRFLTARTGLNSGGAFSPDERRLAFTMSPNGSADLYEYDFQSGRTRRLTFRDGIETSAVWSPSAKELLFVSDRSGTPQIYLLDMESLEDLRLTFESGYNADPKWSPDGEQILFTKRIGRTDQIHIMDRYGENVRSVTSGPHDSEQAEWSPDGKQIVFTSNRSGVFKLYVVSADGTNLRRLTHTPERFEESSPSWTWRRMPR